MLRNSPAVLGVLLVLAAVWAAPGQAQTPRVSLRAAAQSADAIVLATADRKLTEQTEQPNSGTPPYARLQWRLNVTKVLKGKGVKPGQLLLVDEPAWRLDLQAVRACQGRSPCAMPDKPQMDTTLSRPPKSGDAVLVLLRQTRDGWALAFEAAMDDPARAAELRPRGRR
ncbi:MAG: hypothetical protein HY902_04480 [Deltaproteobacteria bacterium]|nr:hypothetical protein [Deltaproteobacteria bacterium]